MEVLHLASVAYSEIVEVLHLAASGMVVVIRFAASEMVVVLVYIAFCVWGWLATRVHVFSVLSLKPVRKANLLSVPPRVRSFRAPWLPAL